MKKPFLSSSASSFGSSFVTRFVESMAKHSANEIVESVLKQAGSMVSHLITANITTSYYIKNYGHEQRAQTFTLYKWVTKLLCEQGNPSLRAVSPDNESGDEISVVAPGSYTFKYQGAWFYVNISENERPLMDTIAACYAIRITTLKRNRHILNEIIRATLPNAVVAESNMQFIYTATPTSHPVLSSPAVVKRKVLDDVIIPDDIKAQIRQRIMLWRDHEDWYFNNNFAHKVSFEFSGPPGTGKTTLAQAIAGELEIPLVVYSTEDIEKGDFAHIMHHCLPKRCVILFDDFDIARIFQTRTDDVNATPAKLSGMVSKTSDLSTVLRTLSGPIPLNGKILVFTTNKHHMIDPAILRKGRIDCHLTINALGDTEIRTFLARHYPGMEDVVPYGVIFAPVTGAELTDRLYQFPTDVKKFITSLPVLKQ